VCDGLECGAVDGHRRCRAGFGHGQRRLWGRGRPLGSLRERVAEARWYHEGERMELREIPGEGYARVLQCHDVDSGLQAMMAIHDTTSGHALGGWRRWPYATRHAALRDALRLARGMPYASAVAETGCGGGKAVVLGDAECTTQRRTCGSLFPMTLHVGEQSRCCTVRI